MYLTISFAVSGYGHLHQSLHQGHNLEYVKIIVDFHFYKLIIKDFMHDNSVIAPNFVAWHLVILAEPFLIVSWT